MAELILESPRSWFIGCGAALNFVAGDKKRAPVWMQKAGLEWAFRLGHEPRRLFGRYILHDMPFAFQLMLQSFAVGARRAVSL